MRRTFFGFSFSFAVVIAAVSFLRAEVAPDAKTRLTEDLKYLASDDLEGRGIGTKGIDLAAEFISKAFRESGLDVTKAGGDPFQEFSMTTGAKLGSPNSLKLIGPEGKSIELAIDKDCQVCSFGASGTFSAEVVFGGYAIDAKDAKYQDFDGIDVKGKVVIVVRKTPRQADAFGPFAAPHGGISPHADLRAKVSYTSGKGAAAILFVNDPYSSKKEAESAIQKIKDFAEPVVELAEKLQIGRASCRERVCYAV